MPNVQIEAAMSDSMRAAEELLFDFVRSAATLFERKSAIQALRSYWKKNEIPLCYKPSCINRNLVKDGDLIRCVEHRREG